MTAIGFIGAGQMGLPMIGNLVAAGHKVTVCDLSPAAREAAAARGAVLAESPRALADVAEVVFSCVTGPAAVRGILHGGEGVIGGRAMRHYVEHATVGPDCARESAAALAASGVGYLDAPITGGIEGAAAGSLTVIASGRAEVLAAVSPLLEVVGSHVLHVSAEVGDAQVMKLANNMIIVGSLAVAAEATLFAVKSGIPAETALDVLNHGMAGGVATRRFLTGFVLERNFASGCALGILHKDVSLGLEAAARAGMPMFTHQMAKTYLDQSLALGRAEADIAAMVCAIEELAGARIARKAG